MSDNNEVVIMSESQGDLAIPWFVQIPSSDTPYISYSKQIMAFYDEVNGNFEEFQNQIFDEAEKLYEAQTEQ